MRIEILEERADGSGRVRMPIIAEAQQLDLARTASQNASGSLSVTQEFMAGLAANWGKWPGPVPVHRSPHRSYGESAGPADGFIENLEFKDGLLLGTMDLTASLFQEVKARQWRAFSPDMARNAKTPSKEIPGWSVYGGVFTNRPATPLQAAVAASQQLSFEESATGTTAISAEATRKERRMASDENVSLAIAEAEKKALGEQVANLETRLAGAKEERDALLAQLVAAEKLVDEARAATVSLEVAAKRRDREATEAFDEAKRLRTEKASLSAKVSDLEARTLRDDVAKIVRKGIAAGIPPSLFDGCDADPVKWFQSKFVSLEALDAFVSQLPKTVKLSAPTTSGKVADDSETVQPEIAAELKRRGLDPKYLQVSTSEDLAGLKK